MILKMRQFTDSRLILIITFLFLCSCDNTLAIISEQEPQIFVEQIIASLSLRERIGQLFMIRVPGIDTLNILQSTESDDLSQLESLIRNYKIGGLFFFGGTVQNQITLMNRFQSMSDLPLLMAQDLELGLSMRLADTIRFPKNMTLGAIQNDSLIYALGKEIARQCRAVGVHINAAPVIDVNAEPENPVINVRSFGQNKEKVVQKAIAFANGLQEHGVVACAKHFPGHGRTKQDSHIDLPRIDLSYQQLHDVELYPFKKLIDAGVQSIMTAHLFVPALDSTQNLPSSLSHKIVNDLLKQELGFNGLVITDGLDMKGVILHHRPGEVELKALMAGNDILILPLDVPKAVTTIERAVIDGKLSEHDIDQSVRKIIQLKKKLGLFDQRLIPEVILKDINTDYAYQLKKELFSQAITLVKNDGDVLPVKSVDNNSIAVVQIGDNAQISFVQELQHGGLHHQFYLPTQASLDAANNLLNALRNYGQIIIGIFGMNRFAKNNFGLSESTLDFIYKINQADHKIITAVFGSPYSLKFFGQESAIVMAYEDDEDAQRAAAHVIQGIRVAQGKLPVSASDQFMQGLGL